MRLKELRDNLQISLEKSQDNVKRFRNHIKFKVSRFYKDIEDNLDDLILHSEYVGHYKRRLGELKIKIVRSDARKKTRANDTRKKRRT